MEVPGGVGWSRTLRAYHLACMQRPHLATPATLVVIVVAAAVSAVLVVVGVAPIVAAASGLVVGLLVVWVLVRRAAALVLASIGGRTAQAGEFPRLHNVVDGLCMTHGIERPELYVLDSPSGNAAVLRGRNSASIVVTTGATDSLALVELEAFMAQALARCRDPHLADETLAALVARVLGARFTAERFGDPDRTVMADIAGADMTRYPPGMQRALEALAEMGTAVEGARAASAHLWLLQPDGRVGSQTAVHPSVELRVDALGEL